MYLLFKIKDKELYNVTSDTKDDLIDFNIGEEQRNYSPKTLGLESNECFKIENFSGEDFYPNFLKQGFAAAQFSQWNKNQKNIDYIVNTNGEQYYFQKFTKSQILKNHWISISGEPKIKTDKIITIYPYANAFYQRESDILYFNKLDNLKKIFPGIESLYREATESEVNAFLNNDSFNIDSYNKDKMGILNRKKIALVQDKLKQLKDIKKFYAGLKNYYTRISFKNEKIIIKTEGDLKNILCHLDEKFYTTENSKEKRLANSIISITNNKSSQKHIVAKI